MWTSRGTGVTLWPPICPPLPALAALSEHVVVVVVVVLHHHPDDHHQHNLPGVTLWPPISPLVALTALSELNPPYYA